MQHLKRRNFLAAMLPMLASGKAFADPFLVSSHEAEACSRPSEDMAHFFRRTYAVPPNMDHNFVGYSPTKANPADAIPYVRYLGFAYNAFKILNNKGAMEITNSMVELKCGEYKTTFIDSAHWLTTSEHPIFNQVILNIRRFHKIYKNKPYAYRVQAAADMLAGSFREILLGLTQRA